MSTRTTHTMASAHCAAAVARSVSLDGCQVTLCGHRAGTATGQGV